jgi:hypothetical protein
MDDPHDGIQTAPNPAPSAGEPPTPKTGFWRSLTAVALAVAVTWWAYDILPRWSRGSADRMLGRLPPGCSRAEAEEILIARGLNPSWQTDPNRLKVGQKNIYQLAGVSPEDVGGYLSAHIPAHKVFGAAYFLPLAFTELSLFVFFDKDGRLISHHVQQHVYWF